MVLAIALGFEIADLRRHQGLAAASPAEIGVARTFAVDVTSFDYRRIDQDTARVVAFASPAYRPALIAAVGPSFANGIVTNRQVLDGAVVEGPAVQGTTPGEVVFLVVVSQRVTSVGSQSAPQSARVALVIGVSREAEPEVVQVQRL